MDHARVNPNVLQGIQEGATSVWAKKSLAETGGFELPVGVLAPTTV